MKGAGTASFHAQDLVSGTTTVAAPATRATVRMPRSSCAAGASLRREVNGDGSETTAIAVRRRDSVYCASPDSGTDFQYSQLLLCRIREIVRLDACPGFADRDLFQPGAGFECAACRMAARPP